LKLLKPNGERIAKIRNDKGLTQDAFGKVTAKTLRKLERGEPARPQTLQRVAERLGVTLEDIVDSRDQASARALDAFRTTWRNANDSDLVITDKVTNSSSTQNVDLEPIDETNFVDAIRAAEVVKWHVDLVYPSQEKLDYLARVARLVDYFRDFVTGVGGMVGLAAGDRGNLSDKESDIPFGRALMQQEQRIELRGLIEAAASHGIKFLWARYTFWGEEARGFKPIKHPVEQNVRLVLATDSEKAKVTALVYVGKSPYEADDTAKGGEESDVRNVAED
jgi:transcriptional regulator with XRE-family HTH domain